MEKERDILRTGAVAVIVMEIVAIDMGTAQGMEMVVAMEMGTVTQKAAAAAAAAILMVTGMERPDMEEVQAGMERAGVRVMVGMEKAGKKVLIVKIGWTPRWTATRWTRWTARQIRHLMALLSQSHPNARKVGGTVRGCTRISVKSVVFNFIFRKILVTRCLRAGLGFNMWDSLPLENWSVETLNCHLIFIQMFSWSKLLWSWEAMRSRKLLFALGEL